MLTRWPALLLSIPLTVLLLSACSEPDFNLPNRNSVGMSNPLIEIHSPLSGSILPANTDFTLDYAILRSEDGHHIKIFVDKKRPMSVFKLEGKHRMHGLPPGKHRIQIIEYTKDGRETGGNITIHLTMAETKSDEPADAAAPEQP
jgi:hypothetical protein